MIEKEQREVERRPITKITHKGEIEIESDAPMKEQEAGMEIQVSYDNKNSMFYKCWKHEDSEKSICLRLLKYKEFFKWCIY